MRPHKKFFSSLKQVEKRLKLENDEMPSPSPSSQCNSISTDSEVSPLYLNSDPTNNTCESETPQTILSKSSPSPSKNETGQFHLIEPECDEIERLMEILGLSEVEDENSLCDSCHCEGSFYEKIVGVKGPKCGKEVERLNGWIEFFNKGVDTVERKDLFKLSHLLLGKASLLLGDDDPEWEFPSTLDEFLKNDPPLKV